MTTIAETARMVCLAFSPKHNGRCVAGIRLDNRQWLRPVGTNATGELYPAQYRFPDLSDPAPWDILDIPLRSIAPRKAYHPEDRLVAAAPWRLVERPATPDESVLQTLEAVRVCEPLLFGCAAKRVLPSALATLKKPTSLALIRPGAVRFQIAAGVPRPGESPRLRFRVWFFLGGAIHELPLTDPRFKERLRDFNIGSYSPVQVGIEPDRIPYLLCSLGEPHTDGYCYKLVATVLTV